MIQYNRVRSSAVTVRPFEKMGERVFVRSNIVRVEEVPEIVDDIDEQLETGFIGWEYDEVVYTLDEYMERVQNENSSMQSVLDYIIMGGV